MTAYADYRMRLVDLQERERSVRVSERQLRNVDETVCRLLDEADDERRLIAELRDQRHELDRQLADLHAAIAATAEQHGFELVDVPEVGGAESAAVAQTA